MQPSPEEHLRGGLGQFLRLANRTKIVCRRVGVCAAAGGNDRPGEFIHRRIVGDAITNPTVKQLHALGIECPHLDVQQVGPLERPKLGELLPFHQTVHQFFALGRIGVGDEFARLVFSRQQADQIQIAAAHEYRVIRERGWIDPQLLQFAKDHRVDHPLRGGRTPGKVDTLRHERQPHRFLPVQKTDEHGGLPRLVECHLAKRSDLEQIVGRFVDRLRRDVAFAAVGEAGLGRDLNLVVRRVKSALGRCHLQCGELGRLAGVILRAFGDPLAEDAVLPRIHLESSSPLVWDLCGGFLEEQAFVRLDEIETAAQFVAGDHLPVPGGRFSAQADLEAALAICVAVAGAHVAAGLGQHRHHLVLI